MARLHEYQGKKLLAAHGVAVPRGGVARSADEAAEIAKTIGRDIIIKVQAWVTGRKAKGGVVMADSPDAARNAAAKLLAMTFGNFPVEEILIEEVIDIQDELFVSLTIDDAAKAPVLLLDLAGGSGIEERAASVARVPIDPQTGVTPQAVRDVIAESDIEPGLHEELISTIVQLVMLARQYETRSLEINPLVTLKHPHRANDGKGERETRIMAADCRITIDDYAVFRHPELGIEIARELDHPPTMLERIGYQIEQDDHRGTFYFAQLPTDGASESKGLIGFHGAGGGGSMMSMDAVTNAGFTLANFCDTSGNPSAAKVYRAARIILAQPGIVGYFGSGSGVASQEQFWSAYGLAKAFLEVNMPIPAVIRLGGNSEDRAVDILESVGKQLPATIEGYKKDDTPRTCAERFAELVEPARATPQAAIARTVPDFVGESTASSFPIKGGRVWIDLARCDDEATRFVIEQSAGLLKQSEEGKPVLAVSEEDVADKDSELIALEIECCRAGKRVVFVDLAIPGIDDESNTMSRGLQSVGFDAT